MWLYSVATHFSAQAIPHLKSRKTDFVVFEARFIHGANRRAFRNLFFNLCGHLLASLHSGSDVRGLWIEDVIADLEASHSHPVCGQRARLVRADGRRGPHRLASRELLDEVIFL